MAQLNRTPQSNRTPHNRTTPSRTTKSTRNTGNAWSTEDDRELRLLVRGNTPTRVIGLKLGRTESSIRSRARRLGISLRPANQSPYG